MKRGEKPQSSWLVADAAASGGYAMKGGSSADARKAWLVVVARV